MRTDLVPLSSPENPSTAWTAKKGLSFGVMLLGFCVFFGSATAQGGVVKQLPLPQLVEYAPLIVRGTIVAQQPIVAEDGSGLIATLSEVRVREVIKGKLPAGPLLIRQPGGTLDDVEQSVPGAARFREGEDVVLFLERAKDDEEVHLVLGMAAGKYRFERSGSGELRAVQDLDGLMAYDGDAAPRGAPRLRVLEKTDAGNAEAFLNELRTLAKGRAR